jgi:hypothetical protein
VDLTGIRQHGGTFQVRVFTGSDPVTGKKVMATGSADTQSGAIELRDEFRKQVREQTAVRTGVTLGYLLDEWLAGHQAEATTLATYRFYVERFLRPTLGDTRSSISPNSARTPTGSSTRSCDIARCNCFGRAPRYRSRRRWAALWLRSLEIGRS